MGETENQKLLQKNYYSNNSCLLLSFSKRTSIPCRGSPISKSRFPNHGIFFCQWRQSLVICSHWGKWSRNSNKCRTRFISTRPRIFGFFMEKFKRIVISFAIQQRRRKFRSIFWIQYYLRQLVRKSRIFFGISENAVLTFLHKFHTKVRKKRRNSRRFFQEYRFSFWENNTPQKLTSFLGSFLKFLCKHLATSL